MDSDERRIRRGDRFRQDHARPDEPEAFQPAVRLRGSPAPEGCRLPGDGRSDRSGALQVARSRLAPVGPWARVARLASGWSVPATAVACGGRVTTGREAGMRAVAWVVAFRRADRVLTG